MDHTITALKAQKRNPERVNVYLDGEFSFGCSRIVAAWLSVGQVISDEKIAMLKGSDEQEVAYQQTLKFIGYRMRTVAEVEGYLQNKGWPIEVRDAVLERLIRSGMVDDNRFAQAWAENRTEFRPRSRRALQRELRFKGVSEDAIEQALQMSPTDGELAYQAGEKYARKLQGLDRREHFRKLAGFLARRGFSYEVIGPVADRLWEEKNSNGTNR